MLLLAIKGISSEVTNLLHLIELLFGQLARLGLSQTLQQVLWFDTGKLLML